MEMYEDFALVYDRFMDETPYEEWCQFVVGRLKQDQITDGILLDLGCGTGSMTELLAKQGYDMIGVDLSDSMLDIAMEKRAQSGHNILYLQQDMREFELYGTVRAVVSICDSMNYILEYQDLVQVFRLVNNYLDPQGIFIFDFNTEYKYREILGNQVIAEDRDECSFIWENYYNHTSMINEYELTLFPKEPALWHQTKECRTVFFTGSIDEIRRESTACNCKRNGRNGEDILLTGSRTGEGAEQSDRRI